MPTETERIIADLRAGVERYGLAANGMIVRVLLDVADQRDELASVAQDALLIIYEIDQNFDIAIEIGGREIKTSEVKERLIAVLRNARPVDDE